MKLNNIIPFLLFASHELHAQITQKGKVLEYYEDGRNKPICGAEISLNSAPIAVSAKMATFRSYSSLVCK